MFEDYMLDKHKLNMSSSVNKDIILILSHTRRLLHARAQVRTYLSVTVELSKSLLNRFL